MRNIDLTQPEVESFLNVWYDAVSKQQDPGGMTGLRKILKITDAFDTIATLTPTKLICNECAKKLGAGMDQYKINADAKNLWMDDELVQFIKASYDKVQWSPMKAKLITTSFDYLDKIPESKPEPVKD